MREPNVLVELNKQDFNLSNQYSAVSSSTTVFGIDFKRLFNRKSASVENSSGISFASVPVVGMVMRGRVSSFALYDLMLENPGYDVVFYPQYEVNVLKPLGLGIIYRKTKVKVTARLGQLKED